MSPEELREIITKGLDVLSMTMDASVQKDIVKFSWGYPHFTHLLSLHACRNAVLRDRIHVQVEPDFRLAINMAIQQSFESLRKAYQDATSGTRESIYEQVLWATAKAEVDEHNTSQPKDLLIPHSNILKKQVKYQAFISHLSHFCSADRGYVLEKSGKKRRVRYKLKDPRMRAFLLLKYQESIKSPPGSQGIQETLWDQTN